MKEWSNLARVVAARTYARPLADGNVENWDQIVERAIAGNVEGHNVPEEEVKQLIRFAKERKAGPAGRGYWFSGTQAHKAVGGVALNNCWFLTGDDIYNYVIACDLLMLGGGVGFSVEARFTSKLPKVKTGVNIVHRATRDADFIVPDSREGWCELLRKVLEAYFETGKSFTYSTVCLRGAGEPIKGFGGISSGPIPLVGYVETVNQILQVRWGKHVRPIDAADLMTAIGHMVVSGNVRRSAIIILGDCWDKEYLKAKRWDLGIVPAHRGRANYSVVCDDAEDLHPSFWKTYEQGEPYGIVNRTNIQKYGRMGELMKDPAIGVNPCAEATLENGEPCNLAEMALCNFENLDEFVQASRLMMRYTKRVCLNRYHHEVCDRVIKKNFRVGIGITGCLSSPLFNSDSLDAAYKAILDEDAGYSKELSVPLSVRHTVVKPSGTMGKVLDCNGEEGIHAALSPFYIQRVQFSSNDRLVPHLRKAGHPVEPKLELDGSADSRTVVASFYVAAPTGATTVEGGWDTWRQLDTVLMAQKHWSDQSVSVTVYYRKEEIPKLKYWLKENLSKVKTISFLLYSGHGFKQAPKEPITEVDYQRAIAKIKPIDYDRVGQGDLDNLECEGGACPIK